MDIIANAKKYLGTPYVWGGDCESEGGLDCSGYVINVLNDSEIKVERTTAQGLYNKFKENKADKKTEGALLFFGKSVSNITHVAIASGDGTHMYESIGSKSNTKKNKGKGVTYSLISRRKDLVACSLPYKKTPTATKKQYLYGGIDYSPVFDPTYYADHNADVKAAYGNDATKLFNHFTIFGMREGRQAHPNFNVNVYRLRYIDLQKAYGSNLKLYYSHYLVFGIKEGRKAV